MAFAFHPLTNHGVIKFQPHILLTTKRVTFPRPEVLVALGNPDWLFIEVDETSKAIRLTLATQPGRPNRKVMREQGNSPYVNVPIMGDRLPAGFYKPLGGGVFIFESPKEHNKKGSK